MIANNAGNANCGGIVPFPISTPINVPIICAITAPGPSNADNNGIEHTNPKATNQKMFPASGVNNLANQLPNPDPWINPINIATNAINGKIVVIID